MELKKQLEELKGDFGTYLPDSEQSMRDGAEEATGVELKGFRLWTYPPLAMLCYGAEEATRATNPGPSDTHFFPAVFESSLTKNGTSIEDGVGAGLPAMEGLRGMWESLVSRDADPLILNYHPAMLYCRGQDCIIQSGKVFDKGSTRHPKQV